LQRRVFAKESPAGDTKVVCTWKGAEAPKTNLNLGNASKKRVGKLAERQKHGQLPTNSNQSGERKRRVPRSLQARGQWGRNK